MKKDSRSGKPLFGQQPPPGLFDSTDKRRLILMSAALVALLVVFVVAQLQRGAADPTAEQRQHIAIEEPTPELLEEVVVPRFDPERLRGKVSDSRETDRVLRERGGIEELAAYVRGFGDPHFAALGVQDLDEAARQQLLLDPQAHRAQPFRARGTVLDLALREDREGREQLDGSLRLETGGEVFFTVLRAPAHLLPSDFVRVDGLFFKLFRDEAAPGEWTEGPYLVGNRALRSYPPLEPFDPERLERRLAEVEDDGTTSMTRLTGDAHLALWELMRFVERPEVLQVNWEAAPELDAALLARIIRDGQSLRGQPVRIPVSRIQDMRTPSAGENPLRLERTSNGWIGNTNWTGGSAVIQFMMPPQARDLERGSYCTARGFFLKNLAYEDRSGNLRTAPYFVLESLDPFVLPENTVMRTIAWFVAGLTIFLAALFFLLLMRDRKKSLQFQAELVRRRRARREGAAGPPRGPNP
jgi:hypothetical protein